MDGTEDAGNYKRHVDSDRVGSAERVRGPFYLGGLTKRMPDPRFLPCPGGPDRRMCNDGKIPRSHTILQKAEGDRRSELPAGHREDVKGPVGHKST